MGFYDANLSCDVMRDAINKFDATQDVKQVVQAIATVIHMSNVGRKEGLLSLEEKFACNPSPEDKDVAPMVLLVVDGTDPAIVAEIFTNTYWANRYEGNEALAQYILMRGTLLVQGGENPRLIQEILISLLPKSLHEGCRQYIEAMESTWKEDDDARIMENFKQWNQIEVENEGIKDRIKEVENLVLKLDDRALQRVMRDIENDDIAACAAVFSDKGRAFILRNMSSGLRIMTMKELLYLATVSALCNHDNEFLYAVEKLEAVIQKLVALGEIIIWDN